MHAPKNCSVIAVGREGLPQCNTRLKSRSFDGKNILSKYFFSQLRDKNIVGTNSETGSSREQYILKLNMEQKVPTTSEATQIKLDEKTGSI
jgi:hypothetical protein